MAFKLLALGLMAVQCVSSLRFAMYADEYHTKLLPGADQTQGITHAIMAFAKSTLFTGDSSGFTPFEPVSTFRNRFSKDTKVMVAVGGWGDTSGFSEGAKTEESRARYAKNIAMMLNSNGFDGVDLDWEYPGGNGQDYKQIPNEQKKPEIESFPLLVQAIRKEIGKEKLLSLAVPGKKVDMIAFTKEQGPKIWPSVDFVNVMTYDLMNRRDNVTAHHTSIARSLEAISNYADIGLEAEKMNLGVAYYAKWFMTDPRSDCSANPLGCMTVPMENPDGSDNGKSGVVTFEKGNMGPPPSNPAVSTDGTCGAGKGKCPAGQCCSQYGSCGTTDEFCQAGCLSDFGECKGVSVTDSWRRAQKEGKTDEKAGGQYYWDPEAHLFWSWDTPELITRKFQDVVAAKKLGGVMAWSLGEDTADWSHLKAMQEGVMAK